MKHWILGVFSVLLLATCSVWAQAWSTATLNTSISQSSAQSVDVGPDGTPYVAIVSNSIIYVSKYNGTSWESVGSAFGDMSASYKPRIYCVTANEIYVAFPELSSSKTSVYQWDGTTWNVVGSRGITPGSATAGLFLAKDNSGQLFLTYNDGTNTLRSAVARWDGSAWTNYSSLSDNGAGILGLKSVTGSVYLYYRETSSTSIYLRRWDGSAWGSPTTIVGSSGSTGGGMAISPTGTIYLSYAASSSLLRVVSGSGSSFSQLGSDVSGGGSNGCGIAVADGIPYIITKGSGSSAAAIVSKWTGTEWGRIGDTIAMNVVPNISFGISSENGKITVGYVGSGTPLQVSVAQTQITKNVTYAAGTNGSLSGSANQTINFGGAASTVTAVADSGYQFSQWSDGVLTAARTDTNVSSNLSLTASFVVESLVTGPPTGFSATSNASSVSLNWTNPSDGNFSSTTLVRGTSGYPATVTDGISVTTNMTENAYLDTVSDGTYYYSLFSKSVSDVYSGPVTASVVVDTTPPSAPSLNATKSSLNGTTVNLEWDVPSTTSTFELYRSFNGGGASLVSASMSSGTTTFEQTSLADGAYVYSI